MKEKSKRGKILTIIEIVIGSIFVAMFIACIAFELAIPAVQDGVDPTGLQLFSQWIKDYVWDIQATGAALNSQLKTIITCLIFIVLIYAVSKLIRIFFRSQMQKSNRAKTVITLLDGLVKYGCAIALIMLVLKACGVDTAALWASAGILALVIGLGAQSLIADIIAGIFIIFEGEYEVGEIISIDDFRGTVSEIGIRATKLLDAAGNIKIINNSDIKNVVNMSRELSLAVVDCEFPYDVPVEFVEKLLKDNFESFKNDIPAIVEGPFYKGVSAYEASNVAVKIVAKCKEEDRYQVQRDLLRAYRSVFKDHGIDLSFDQVVVSQYQATDIKATKAIKREAEQFVEEQKELSEGMEQQTKE